MELIEAAAELLKLKVAIAEYHLKLVDIALESHRKFDALGGHKADPVELSRAFLDFSNAVADAHNKPPQVPGEEIAAKLKAAAEKLLD